MSEYASFVAPITPRGKRVMVVQNASTKQWMLPGGLVDRGESASSAAIREMKEESGFKARGLAHVSRKATQRGSVDLYATVLNSSDVKSHNHRVNTFCNRTTPGETCDYGFVNVKKPTWTVESYSGQPKNTQSLRSGSKEHLAQMRRVL